MGPDRKVCPARTVRFASLRGARLLDGVRGSPPVDRAAVANLLVDLGRAVVGCPDIREVDLNPVIVSAAGAVAVDALVVIEAVPGG